MSATSTDAIKIARRYATAIFALATEAKKEKDVVEEISVLAEAITGSEELKDALGNPLLAPNKKAKLLAALIKKADKLTQNAVETIASAGRASLIPTIAAQLRARLTEQQGEIEAIVTSARPLAVATKKQLMQSLNKATGKDVQLTLREDPTVLGGLSIQLGSLYLDATLAGALNTMREKLLATAN